MYKFGILVLAAGQSSRFGSDKLLAKMPDDRPVIAHSLAPLQSIADTHGIELCVVTRADNSALINYLSEHKIRYTLCPDAHLGMGNSIAHGVKQNQSWHGWMITLADMPNLNSDVLDNLLTNIAENINSIVRPKLRAQDKSIPAHPVYFPQSYGFKLAKLSGDNGAKHIIQQQKWLEMVDSNCFIDVDTPEVLQQLHKQKERTV